MHIGRFVNSLSIAYWHQANWTINTQMAFLTVWRKTDAYSVYVQNMQQNLKSDRRTIWTRQMRGPVRARLKKRIWCQRSGLYPGMVVRRLCRRPWSIMTANQKCARNDMATDYLAWIKYDHNRTRSNPWNLPEAQRGRISAGDRVSVVWEPEQRFASYEWLLEQRRSWGRLCRSHPHRNSGAVAFPHSCLFPSSAHDDEVAKDIHLQLLPRRTCERSEAK